MLNGCPKSKTGHARARTTCYRILSHTSEFVHPGSGFNHGQSNGQGEEHRGKGKGKDICFSRAQDQWIRMRNGLERTMEGRGQNRKFESARKVPREVKEKEK